MGDKHPNLSSDPTHLEPDCYIYIYAEFVTDACLSVFLTSFSIVSSWTRSKMNT